MEHDNDNTCSICFDNKNDIKTICCKQNLCYKCDEKLFHTNCPFCRQQIKTTFYIENSKVIEQVNLLDIINEKNTKKCYLVVEIAENHIFAIKKDYAHIKTTYECGNLIEYLKLENCRRKVKKINKKNLHEYTQIDKNEPLIKLIWKRVNNSCKICSKYINSFFIYRTPCCLNKICDSCDKKYNTKCACCGNEDNYKFWNEQYIAYMCDIKKEHRKNIYKMFVDNGLVPSEKSTKHEKLLINYFRMHDDYVDKN